MKKHLTIAIIAFLFFSNAIGQLKVNSSGNVGIGVDPSSYKLYISGSTMLKQGNMRMWLSGDKITFSHYSAMDNMIYYHYNWEPYLYPESDDVGYIGSSTKNFYRIYGRYIYANGVSLTSDERQKENIRDLSNPIEKIMNIRAVQFDFKTNLKPEWSAKKKEEIAEKSKDRIGFLAQELLEVYPELVEHDSVNDQYSVDYNGMIPILLEAIKEQQSQIRLLQDAILSKEELKGSSIVSTETDFQSIQNSASTLYQNAPNPFNENTIIKYIIPVSASEAMINLYDLQGKQKLSFKIHQTGNGEILIPAAELDPGIFIYNLIINGTEVASRRMVLTD